MLAYMWSTNHQVCEIYKIKRPTMTNTWQEYVHICSCLLCPSFLRKWIIVILIVYHSVYLEVANLIIILRWQDEIYTYAN